jgi:hypothetical protein
VTGWQINWQRFGCGLIWRHIMAHVWRTEERHKNLVIKASVGTQIWPQDLYKYYVAVETIKAQCLITESPHKPCILEYEEACKHFQ